MSGGRWVDSGRHKLTENIWLCGLKGHIVDIWRDVTLEEDTHTHGRNVKIVLEFWKQNSQNSNIFKYFPTHQTHAKPTQLDLLSTK